MNLQNFQNIKAIINFIQIFRNTTIMDFILFEYIKSLFK